MERINAIIKGTSKCIINTLRIILFIFCTLMLLDAVISFISTIKADELFEEFEITTNTGPVNYLRSIFLFGLALLGCHGSYKGSEKHLKLFALIIAIYAVISGVGVVTYMALSDVEGMQRNFTHTLETFGQKYQFDIKAGDQANKETRAWNLIQRNLHCCGLSGPEDWPRWRRDLPKDNYPESCCLSLSFSNSNNDGKRCRKNEAYHEGCGDRIRFIAALSVISAIGNSFIYLLMALFAIITAKHFEVQANLLPFHHQKLNEVS